MSQEPLLNGKKYTRENLDLSPEASVAGAGFYHPAVPEITSKFKVFKSGKRILKQLSRTHTVLGTFSDSRKIQVHTPDSSSEEKLLSRQRNTKLLDQG